MSETPPYMVSERLLGNNSVLIMNALEHLEQQVLQLSSEDLAKFRAWFLELDHQLWDKEIEADFQAGKLDHLINEARAGTQGRKDSRALRYYSDRSDPDVEGRFWMKLHVSSSPSRAG